MSKIEGQPNLKRDDSNMAIINTDTASYKRYKAQKEKYKSQENEINTLKDELREIKGLVNKLLERECNG